MEVLLIIPYLVIGASLLAIDETLDRLNNNPHKTSVAWIAVLFWPIVWGIYFVMCIFKKNN